jgi:hypothetical protein
MSHQGQSLGGAVRQLTTCSFMSTLSTPLTCPVSLLASASSVTKTESPKGTEHMLQQRLYVQEELMSYLVSTLILPRILETFSSVFLVLFYNKVK